MQNMMDQFCFWTKVLIKPLIIKLFMYFILVPMGMIIAGQIGIFDHYQIEKMCMDILSVIVPVLSCWNLVLVHGEFTSGLVSEFGISSYFEVLYSLVSLLFNIILVIPIIYVINAESEKAFDTCVKMSIVVFFMCGLSMMLVQLAQNVSFSIFIVIAYTLISNCAAFLNVIAQGQYPYLLSTVIERNNNPVDMDFVLAGIVFWVVGIFLIKNKKWRE